MSDLVGNPGPVFSQRGSYCFIARLPVCQLFLLYKPIKVGFTGRMKFILCRIHKSTIDLVSDLWICSPQQIVQLQDNKTTGIYSQTTNRHVHSDCSSLITEKDHLKSRILGVYVCLCVPWWLYKCHRTFVVCRWMWYDWVVYASACVLRRWHALKNWIIVRKRCAGSTSLSLPELTVRLMLWGRIYRHH